MIDRVWSYFFIIKKGGLSMMNDDFYIGHGINSCLMRENIIPVLYPNNPDALKYRKSRLEIMDEKHFQMLKDPHGYKIWAERFYNEYYCLPQNAIITDVNQNKVTISTYKPISVIAVKNMKRIKSSDISRYISDTMLTRNYTLTLCIRLKKMRNTKFPDTIRLNFTVPSNGEGRTPPENIISYIRLNLNRNMIVYNKVLDMESVYKTYRAISRTNEFNHPDLESDNVTVVITGEEFHNMCAYILTRTSQYSISKYLLHPYFNKINPNWMEGNGIRNIYVYLVKYFNNKLNTPTLLPNADTYLQTEHIRSLATFPNEFYVFASYVVDEISGTTNTTSYLMARLICVMYTITNGDEDKMITLENAIDALVRLRNY